MDDALLPPEAAGDLPVRAAHLRVGDVALYGYGVARQCAGDHLAAGDWFGVSEPTALPAVEERYGC